MHHQTCLNVFHGSTELTSQYSPVSVNTWTHHYAVAVRINTDRIPLAKPRVHRSLQMFTRKENPRWNTYFSHLNRDLKRIEIYKSPMARTTLECDNGIDIRFSILNIDFLKKNTYVYQFKLVSGPFLSKLFFVYIGVVLMCCIPLSSF